MTARIARVGIVAKHGLLAASEHLARLGEWLRERRIEAVYETTTAQLTTAIGAQATPPTRTGRHTTSLPRPWAASWR